MTRQKKSLIVVLSVLVLSLLFSIQCAAIVPYSSYNYDSNGEVGESVDIYETSVVLSGEMLGIGDFADPSDFYCDGDILYLLDAGNNRVVVINLSDSTAEVFTIKDGEKQISLSKDGSIFVDEAKTVFITDSGNKCIWLCDLQGNVLEKITRPDSEYLSDSIEFLPKKIIGDRVGNIYVQCTGVYEGFLIFNEDREFTGFFGSEKVGTSSSVLSSYFWKQFMTAEQKETMANYVPKEILSMDITYDNFLYTITPTSAVGITKVAADKIRCLNPKGTDILESFMSNKVEAAFNFENRYLNFIDLAYSESGYINVLDNRQGRIYQFDKNMQLITAFGALGSYEGTFTSPVAIEACGDDILVLDNLKNNITIFSITETGKTVHKALGLYNDGNFKESMEPWLEVTEKYPNFQLAYMGIGNALYNEGEYKEAMEYYEIAKDTEGYGKAYKEYRIIAMRENAIWIAIAIAAVFIAWKLIKKFAGSKLPTMKSLYNSTGGGIMVYSVFHPFNGFDRIRTRKLSSSLFCVITFILLIILGVCEQQYMGKSFSMAESYETNLLGVIAVRAALILLFTVSNWAIGALSDGKANFSQICHFTFIALIPYIACGFIRVALSHVLVSSESIFMTITLAVGVIWALWLLMTAFSSFHEYELGKGILIFIITIIGMFLIVILGFLIYSLAQNVIDFVKTVFSEAVFRINV